jgi:hypothetical protein
VLAGNEHNGGVSNGGSNKSGGIRCPIINGRLMMNAAMWIVSAKRD